MVLAIFSECIYLNRRVGWRQKWQLRKGKQWKRHYYVAHTTELGYIIFIMQIAIILIIK